MRSLHCGHPTPRNTPPPRPTNPTPTATPHPQTPPHRAPGHTQQAGYVLVGSGRKRGVTLISAVLGAPSESARDADTRRLLAWAFARYRSVRAAAPAEVIARTPIRYRRGAEL